MVEKVKTHISRGRTKEAINLLLNEIRAIDESFYNQVLLISGRYQHYILNASKGLISQEENKIEINHINQSILYIIEFIEENKVVETEDSTTNEKISIAISGDVVVLNDTSQDFKELVYLLTEQAGISPSGNKNNSSYSQRAMNRLMKKETRRQKNIECILTKALESISSSNQSINPSNLDSDWISDFFNVCQDFSDETMQHIWAVLLANEVDKPGQFSRRTLHTIKLLDASEAALFTKLCCCIWNMEEQHLGSDNMLIMDMDEEGQYSDESWGFDGAYLSKLEELGLIHISYLELDKKRSYQLTFYGKRYTLKSTTNTKRLDVAALTRVGNEIFKVCGSKPNHAYYLSTIDYLKESNIWFLDKSCEKDNLEL